MTPQRKYFYKTLDNFTCIYCGKKFTEKELTVDHIVPQNLAKKCTYFNIVVACKDCNLGKGDFIPRDFRNYIQKNGIKKSDNLKKHKNFYLSLNLYYYCAGVFKYIPNRNFNSI